MPADSDGDGCADSVEMVDINGDRKADGRDLYLLARRAANIIPPDPVSDKVFDINQDGKINGLDQYLVARNACSFNPTQIGCPVCPPE